MYFHWLALPSHFAQFGVSFRIGSELLDAFDGIVDLNGDNYDDWITLNKRCTHLILKMSQLFEMDKPQNLKRLAKALLTFVLGRNSQVVVIQVYPLTIHRWIALQAGFCHEIAANLQRY